MAQNPTQITGLAFSELKAEKKQLVSENEVWMNLNWTVASCPARIDLFGGWTDTPPICYSIEGAVVNAAITINEKHPITAKGRRIPQKVIKLIEEDKSSQNPAQFIRSLKDLENYRDPSLPGALFKACLIGSGFVNPSGPLLELQLQSTGIEIRTCSELPHGSGLGTSSILASCIIAVLWKLKNSKITIENEKLFHTVLKTEELLTTGGGWQDQVGGVVGGVKIGRCSNGSSFRITYEKIDSNISLLNENLKLIYTGKTRLAKNLLETVLQNWQNGEPEVTSALEELRLGSVECVRALQTEDMTLLGQCLSRYWYLKKILAKDAEPPHVSRLLNLIQPHTYGACLAGAGGGGFLIILVKRAKDFEKIRSIINNSQDPEIRQCSLYDLKIDTCGLKVTSENNSE